MHPAIVKIKEFQEKYKERLALAGVAIAFLVSVAGGLYLQKRKEHKKEPVAIAKLQKINIVIPKKGSSSGNQGEVKNATTFFLKPSPAELLEQLEQLDSFDENIATKKFNGLRVMWPVYFFSLQKEEGGKTLVQLDVSENGFGVILFCEVNLAEYPQILELEVGKKIWVAGEILSVDPSGTGTIYLKADYFRFKDEGPVIPADKKE